MCCPASERPENTTLHYNDVIMSAKVSLITSLMIVYSTVYSDTDERKHQNSVNSPHKGPATRKCFHWMTSSWRQKSTQSCFKNISKCIYPGDSHVRSTLPECPMGLLPDSGWWTCRDVCRDHLTRGFRWSENFPAFPTFVQPAILSIL